MSRWTQALPPTPPSRAAAVADAKLRPPEAEASVVSTVTVGSPHGRSPPSPARPDGSAGGGRLDRAGRVLLQSAGAAHLGGLAAECPPHRSGTDRHAVPAREGTAPLPRAGRAPAGLHRPAARLRPGTVRQPAACLDALHPGAGLRLGACP